MAAPLDVCIRGAGVVGRTLALLLARDRLRVGLVESPESGPADVRAYAMNAASRGLLDGDRDRLRDTVVAEVRQALADGRPRLIDFGLAAAGTLYGVPALRPHIEDNRHNATRFLVITHHPMTMSRMSRLFGVTMAERGVSQLVSVDLETAQKFTEAA